MSDNETVRLSNLFDVSYGTKFDLKQMKPTFAKMQPYRDEYAAKVKSLWAEYRTKVQILKGEYNIKERPLWDDYYAQEKQFWQECKAKVRQLGEGREESLKAGIA